MYKNIKLLKTYYYPTGNGNVKLVHTSVMVQNHRII